MIKGTIARITKRRPTLFFTSVLLSEAHYEAKTKFTLRQYQQKALWKLSFADYQFKSCILCKSAGLLISGSYPFFSKIQPIQKSNLTLPPTSPHVEAVRRINDY